MGQQKIRSIRSRPAVPV